MQNSNPEQQVEQAYLQDLVQKALDYPGLRLKEWTSEQLHGGVEWDSAVFRFKGQAIQDGESVPWSLILKTVRQAEKSSQAGGIWYWKREALAYRSGLLHHLPGGNVTAPACYRVDERPDGSLWLWLEDLQDDVPCPWSIEQYAAAAHQLGQFNGAYLAGQQCPTEEWVTHNWLRMYTANASPMIQFIQSNPSRPIVQHLLPGGTLAQVLAIWDEHEQILDILDNLPQVFCHQDAFRRNLFCRGGRTLAIDWGYMGIAPVGAELVALVAASMGFWEIPAERVREMERLCFEGYLQGLREAGWKGDPRLVCTGYVVSLMLRYPIGGTVGELLPTFLDQERRTKLESTFENRPSSELEKSDPAIVAYYEAILPEALKLLGSRKLLRLVGRIGLHTLRLRMGREK